VLGHKPNAPLKSETQAWIEYEIGPGTLGIGCSEQWKPSQDGPSVALEVKDFNAAGATLREHNVPIIIGQMEMPTCAITLCWEPRRVESRGNCGVVPDAQQRFSGRDDSANQSLAPPKL
jgi:hypothetical protein